MNRAEALRHLRRTGLYAILDAETSGGRELVRIAADLSRAGVRIMQVRAKTMPDADMLALTLAVRRAARRSAVIVNDRCDIARIAGAAGVHLGQDDLPVASARRILGRGGIVGLSAGTRAEIARAAAARPDYTSIGPAYATRTKRDAGRPLGPGGFRRLAALLGGRGPVLAVGGISPDNVGVLVRSGADAVAAASCWSDSRNIGRTVVAFRRAVEDARSAPSLHRFT